jgi:hypothetical protein
MILLNSHRVTKNIAQAAINNQSINQNIFTIIQNILHWMLYQLQVLSSLLHSLLISIIIEAGELLIMLQPL